MQENSPWQGLKAGLDDFEKPDSWNEGGVGSGRKIWHGSVGARNRNVGALGQIKLTTESLTYLRLQPSREHAGLGADDLAAPAH